MSVLPQVSREQLGVHPNLQACCPKSKGWFPITTSAQSTYLAVLPCAVGRTPGEGGLCQGTLPARIAAWGGRGEAAGLRGRQCL